MKAVRGFDWREETSAAAALVIAEGEQRRQMIPAGQQYSRNGMRGAA